MREREPLGWCLRTYREAIIWAQEHPDDPELVGCDDEGTLFILTSSQHFGGDTLADHPRQTMTTQRER